MPFPSSRLLDLMGELPHDAAAFVGVGRQGLAAARGIDRHRRQQVAQLLRRTGVEGTVGAAGKPRDLPEGIGDPGILALMEHEAGHAQQPELPGQVSEPVDVLLQGVADEDQVDDAEADLDDEEVEGEAAYYRTA